MWKIPEQFRIQDPRLPFHQNAENCPDCGVFLLQPKIGNRRLLAVASNGGAWEHVSVSVREGNKVKTPVWEEMAHVKSVFWGEEDCVVEYHPPRSVYVNCHPNVLHLWRPLEQKIPLPPSIFVGFTDVEAAGMEGADAGIN
jgi:hypothetical protein